MMYSEFLNGWKLDLDKIPKYEEFSKTFTERLDKRVICLLLKSDDYHACVKRNFKNNILPHIRDDGTYSHKYYQTGKIKIGRYYASTITDFPRKFKHTLFHHLGYVDIDQVKGHPSIIMWLGKTNNIEFPNIQKYVNNPISIFAEMREFYGEHLKQHQMKWAFNMMIYGGTPEKWIKHLVSPPKKDREEGWLPTQLRTKEIMPSRLGSPCAGPGPSSCPRSSGPQTSPEHMYIVMASLDSFLQASRSGRAADTSIVYAYI